LIPFLSLLGDKRFFNLLQQREPTGLQIKQRSMPYEERRT